eukprot:TRINITY_DN14491_c0_g1_i1.p1 TRINITY_DN14491_c0_g1~~TRINITY_DN14491_c0_g1_i1.p1  ORF type:complete len:172 (+),score=41.39 TRINITY_DN14491_c0_g1_i1:202-717(+)
MAGEESLITLRKDEDKLRQKLAYLQAEKTRAIASKNFSDARRLVPEISQTELTLVDMEAAIAKARKLSATANCSRDRRVIENQATLTALQAKKQDLIQAENYRELARLQEEMNIITTELEEDGAIPVQATAGVTSGKGVVEEEPNPEGGRELRDYQRMRADEKKSSWCILS